MSASPSTSSVWFEVAKTVGGALAVGFGIGYGVTMARHVIDKEEKDKEKGQGQGQGQGRRPQMIGSVIRLRSGTEDKYFQLHAAVWPKVPSSSSSSSACCCHCCSQ